MQQVYCSCGNVRVQGPLEVLGKGIRGVGMVVRSVSYYRNYFSVAVLCLSSYVSNVFCLNSMCLCALYPQVSDTGKMHSLVPSTILSVILIQMQLAMIKNQ
jgi:hypothetical protein